MLSLRSCYLPFFGFCLWAAAGEADAQMSSSNCMAMGGGMVHCDTMNMGASGGVVSSGDDGSTALVLQGLGDLLGFNGEKSIRKKVGKMLAGGDCAGARRYALEKGRMELAKQVGELCQARTVTAAADVTPVVTYSGPAPVTNSTVIPLPSTVSPTYLQSELLAKSAAVPPKATQRTVRRASSSLAAPIVINDYSVPAQR